MYDNILYASLMLMYERTVFSHVGEKHFEASKFPLASHSLYVNVPLSVLCMCDCFCLAVVKPTEVPTEPPTPPAPATVPPALDGEESFDFCVRL